MKDLIKWLKIAKEQQDVTEQENEGYNVFYALKIWQKETTLHSRLIADLLHPRGYHGLGIKPMEFFMECLKSSLNLNVNFECNDKVKVIAEKATDEARRIDIFLKDENGQVIIIENKIYATDQSKQLWDYYEFGGKVCGKDKKPVVLYLTLAGTMPCKDSAKGLNPDSDYYCISYQDFIKKWISQCLSITKGNNALTEVLKQYLQVIKYLTQENMEDVKWIMDNMESKEDYDALLRLAKVANDIPAVAQDVFYKKLRNRLGAMVYSSSSTDNRHQIWIELDSKEEWEGLKSWLLVEVSTPRAWCGFTVWKNNTEGGFLCEAKEQVRHFENVLEKKGIKKGSDYWVNSKYYWWYMDDVWGTGNFKWYNVIKDIFNNECPDCVRRVGEEIVEIRSLFNNRNED